MEDVLIVDGYNIIGAWPELIELKRLSLEEARRSLISKMSEYQAFSGTKVIIVFDAHQIAGRGRRESSNRVKVLYSGEDETADEMIERLVGELNSKRRNIFVATSDYTEQTVIFGQGAFRIPARELLERLEKSKIELTKELERSGPQKMTFGNKLSYDIWLKLEQMRREK